MRTACHECWQCREQAVHDWVGRNIAESYTAKATYALTLTYGRGRAGDVSHERASVLTYSDVQKFLKLLRRHGYDVRYHVTGEYGGKKGRAHWHIVLYFMNKKPPVVLEKNWMWEAVNSDGKRVFHKGEQQLFWPHGFVFITKPSYKAVRYNMKYIMKDLEDDVRQGHMAMSKKPPLGTFYFKELAEQYVEQGLAPQTLEYTFPQVRRKTKDGREELVKFRLKGRPAGIFLDHYMEFWAQTRPDDERPKSQLIDEYLDPDKRKLRLLNEVLAELGPIEHWTVRQGMMVNDILSQIDEIESPEDSHHPLTPPEGFRPPTEDEKAAILAKARRHLNHAVSADNIDWTLVTVHRDSLMARYG